jgi:hypothetical protein
VNINGSAAVAVEVDTLLLELLGV